MGDDVVDVAASGNGGFDLALGIVLEWWQRTECP